MLVMEQEAGGYRCAHLLRSFCTLSLLFELRVNSLLFLLNELCLPEECSEFFVDDEQAWVN